MRPYHVYIHLDLLEVVRGAGRDRGHIVKFLHHLREHPDTRGDYIEKGADQREHDVKIIGAYAIAYWLDAPVNTIMVVAVRPAD